MNSDDLKSVINKVVTEPKAYVNFGLTLAAAFSWVEAGKQLITDLKLGGNGAYIQAVLMTILAIISVQIFMYLDKMTKNKKDM